MNFTIDRNALLESIEQARISYLSLPEWVRLSLVRVPIWAPGVPHEVTFEEPEIFRNLPPHERLEEWDPTEW